MSKNTPKQNVQAVKEWLAFMKFKPKKKIVPSGNTFGDYMEKDSFKRS
jgi:hypothetical protein